MKYDSDNAIRNIAGAPYQVLRQRFRILADVLDLLAAERRALDDEIRRRERAVSAEMRVGALKADDKRVLREIIDAGA